MNALVRFDTKRLDAALKATRRDYDLFINGQRVKNADGRILERRSPAHGIVVSRCQQAGAAETEAAIAAARTAYDAGYWPRIKGADRAALL